MISSLYSITWAYWKMIGTLRIRIVLVSMQFECGSVCLWLISIVLELFLCKHLINGSYLYAEQFPSNWQQYHVTQLKAIRVRVAGEPGSTWGEVCLGCIDREVGHGSRWLCMSRAQAWSGPFLLQFKGSAGRGPNQCLTRGGWTTTTWTTRIQIARCQGSRSGHNPSLWYWTLLKGVKVNSLATGTSKQCQAKGTEVKTAVNSELSLPWMLMHRWPIA